MQGREQGELYRGFGEGYSRAFELAITPAIIGALGHLLDRWLGIVPVLTIVFFLLGMTGLMARMWYAYAARMEAHEASGPWASQASSVKRAGSEVAGQ